MVEKNDEGKFLVKGAVITELLENEQKKLKNFEVEFKHDPTKVVPGTEIKMNSEVRP